MSDGNSNNPRLRRRSQRSDEFTDETVAENTQDASAATVSIDARPRRSNPIARLVNRWFDRVMGLVKDGGRSDQEEEYAAHRTTRDFIWNSIGAGSWGLVFPIVTMVATQLVGTEQAGMVSMAFTVGLLLMFVANFGVRTFQISDVNETHSFNDYQISRVGTCIVMLLVGILYCVIRGYDSEMFSISMGVFAYRMVDGLADVYEGRLQQVDKLYLAGISQTFRSVLAVLTFSITLLITRNSVAASIAMAIAAAATFVIITFPLALLESPRSRHASWDSLVILFKSTFPLFLGIFLFNVIESMPKFVMEGWLPYDNQLYYNALYFPAQAIFMVCQLVYKPLLVRMAGVWQDISKRHQFTVILVGIFLIIIVITVVAMLILAWIGVPILNLLYGVDFEEFRGLLLIMLVAGGVVASSDFLYQVVTIMRRQRDVTALYCVTFGLSIFISILLVAFTELPGAILSYLIVMSILLVLLVWEYIRIRIDLASGSAAVEHSAHGSYKEQNSSDSSHGTQTIRSAQGTTRKSPTSLEGYYVYDDQTDSSQSQDEPKDNDQEEASLWERQPRPSEVRAERLHREEVIARRTKKHKS